MDRKQSIRKMAGTRGRAALEWLIAAIVVSAIRQPLTYAEEAEQPAAKTASVSPAQIDFFERQVRPLLVEHCHKCHGPQKQEAGLRLDSRGAILKGGDSGPAISPADPASSLLLEAVSYTPDAVVEMPPDGHLSKPEVAILKRWVGQGMPWPENDVRRDADGSHAKVAAESQFSPEQTDFWAFQPLQSPVEPKVKASSWVKSPIDAFILAQLEQRGITPAAPADKRTLIRRATFDLTGLPPTPAEVEAFLADDSPAAFDKVIERLLASPRYGQRWGRHWLDVARYADSNGMDENLAYANAFRYRDYVVRAFNRDKPYDEFVREQIAGDLMPAVGDESTVLDRLVATGFLALGPKMLAEDDPVKMQMDIVDEQIDTIGKCFMGLTLGCARCHDHKFDPITMADYYALAGIFKSTKTMTDFKVVAHWYNRPVESRAVVARYEAYQSRRAAEEKAIDELKASANRELLAAARRRVGDYLLAATDVLDSGEVLEQLAKHLNDRVKSGQPLDELSDGLIAIEAEAFTRGNVDRTVQAEAPRVEIILTYKAGRWSAEYDVAVPRGGRFVVCLRYAAAERRPLRLFVNGKLIKAAAAAQTTGSWNPDGQRWFAEAVATMAPGTNLLRLECDPLFPHVDRLLLVPLKNVAGATSETRSLEEVAAAKTLNPRLLEQWVEVLRKTRTQPDSIFAPWHQLHQALRSATKPAGRETLLEKLTDDFVGTARADLARRYQQLFAKAEVAWRTLKSVEAAKAVKALPDKQLEAFRQVLYDPSGPFGLPDDVKSFYPPSTRDQLEASRQRLQALKAAAPPPLRYAMGVTDGEVHNARICIRGNHVNLGDEVPRRIPQIFAGGESPKWGDQTSGRRELALWLTQGDHPLTSRVMVNRIWRWHFGAGLVRTPDNFGRMGERPDNQPLLDWLAHQFVEQHWSIKQMHRLIMQSSAYQMSTDYQDKAAAIDPENRLLWRMNRQRLDAEEIRDAVLFVAGTLDSTQGGSLMGVKDHDYVTATTSRQDLAYANVRRSIYQPVIRSALYEMFQVFDFPDPSTLQGDRSTTTVAPQALFLLNSRFLDQQTAAMAGRLIAECDDSPENRIAYAFTLALGRRPTADEVSEVKQFFSDYESRATEVEPDESRRELLAWKGFCRVLLASSEFLYLE